jgi:hypothetical protein
LKWIYLGIFSLFDAASHVRSSMINFKLIYLPSAKCGFK